jgi:tRNA(adenine34) deaminase
MSKIDRDRLSWLTVGGGSFMHSRGMDIRHEDFMGIALEEARAAQAGGEVPVGAVLVDGQGTILSRDHNRTITRCDPTAHAEVNVLREAAVKLGNYRLLSTTLYVTVEPCVMCMGALIHARVARVVFGAPDPKWGAAGSLYDLAQDARLNHRIELIEGICEAACRELMQTFFKLKRCTRRP